MGYRARPLVGAAAAAIVATIVPAFAAGPPTGAPEEACAAHGVEASFGIQRGDATRLGHVLVSGFADACRGQIVTVEVGGVRRHAIVDGPAVAVHVDGAVPLTAVTSVAIDVRPPD